jgi:myosin-crossreactive antigen
MENNQRFKRFIRSEDGKYEDFSEKMSEEIFNEHFSQEWVNTFCFEKFPGEAKCFKSIKMMHKLLLEKMHKDLEQAYLEIEEKYEKQLEPLEKYIKKVECKTFLEEEYNLTSIPKPNVKPKT